MSEGHAPTVIDPPRIGIRPGYRRPEVSPVPGEHLFRTEELFFSTTNLKGIIQTGNEVFVRISLFDRSDLIGAPHNIIRHPDMPKLVFKVLWDTIASGRPISAYVKNMARDGKAYWVLANVFPVVVDGTIVKYISVRTRPISPVFELIPSLYAAIREAECGNAPGEDGGIEQGEDGGNAPGENDGNSSGEDGGIARGLAVLTEALTAHGFRDYFAFMSHVLMEESRALMAEEDEAFFVRAFHRTSANASTMDAYQLSHRSAVRLSLVIRNLDQLRDAMGRIESLRTFTSCFAYRVKLLSLNTVLTAASAGREGASIGIIAQNILECSREVEVLESEFNELASTSAELLESTINGIVLVKFQLLMIFKFLEEVLVGGEDISREAAEDYAGNERDLFYVLARQLEAAVANAAEVQALFRRLLGALERQSQVVRKLMSSQNVGRIQTVYASRKRAALETLFGDIRACGEEARATVDDLVVDFRFTEKCFQDIKDAVARVRVDADVAKSLVVTNR